jgi:hypothetical protein
VLADINARVARYRSTKDTKEFFDRYYETTGRLKIPMLTLHNERDPQVPAFNEAGTGSASRGAVTRTCWFSDPSPGNGHAGNSRPRRSRRRSGSWSCARARGPGSRRRRPRPGLTGRR